MAGALPCGGPPSCGRGPRRGRRRVPRRAAPRPRSAATLRPRVAGASRGGWARRSKLDRGGAVRVAVEVDGYGEGGDVGRKALDVYPERRHPAAVARGTDAGGVYGVEELALELGEPRVGVRPARGAGEGPLCEQGGPLEGAADAHPDG